MAEPMKTLFRISISIFMNVLRVPPPSATLYHLHLGHFEVRKPDFQAEIQIFEFKSRFGVVGESRSSQRLAEGGGTPVNVVPDKFKYFYECFGGSATFRHPLRPPSRLTENQKFELNPDFRTKIKIWYCRRVQVILEAGGR